MSSRYHSCFYQPSGPRHRVQPFQYISFSTSLLPITRSKRLLHILFSSVHSHCSLIGREAKFYPHVTRLEFCICIWALCFHTYTNWLCKNGVKLNKGRVIVGNFSWVLFPASREFKEATCGMQHSFHFTLLRGKFACEFYRSHLLPRVVCI